MKKIIKFVLTIGVVAMFWGCTPNVDTGETYLDVTPNNISGVWAARTFDGGAELEEGSYFYIDFKRADRTFVSYDNLKSYVPRVRSGRYDFDVNEATIIYGVYDYGQGDWQREYYVRNLTKTTMEWVATDDESCVCVYVRAELPEELKALTPNKD